MFDATHPGIGGFFDLYSLWYVTGERQAKLGSFLGDREEDLARCVVVHLEEVDARALQVGHGFPGLPRVGHPAAVRIRGWGVVQYGPCSDNLGAENRAG